MTEKREIVKKNHELVTAKFSMTTLAQNIMTTAIYLFNKECRRAELRDLLHKKDEKAEAKINIDMVADSYSIPRHHLAELWGVKEAELKYTDTEKTKSPMVKAAKELVGARIEVKTRNDFEVINMVESVKYNSNGLTIVFTSRGKHFLYQTNKGFALIDLKIYMALKNRFSKRLFEILVRYKKIDPQITFEKLKDLLGVTVGKEKDFSSNAVFFRGAVEDPIKEIVAVSKALSPDCYFDYNSPEDEKKPYRVERRYKNRTLPDDKVVFLISEVKPKEEIEVEKDKPEPQALNDNAVAIRIYEVVVEGGQFTKEEAIYILNKTDQIIEAKIMTKEQIQTLVVPRLFG